jgi:hypothetical protein
MSRKSYEQMLADVVSVITQAGGIIGHNELLELIDPQTQMQVINMAQSKHIIAVLDANPDGPAVLRYRLPGDTVPAAAPAGGA